MTSYYGRFGQQKPKLKYNLNQNQQNNNTHKSNIRQQSRILQSISINDKLKQSHFSRHQSQNQGNILFNSHLVARQNHLYKYVKYDIDGNTQLVSHLQGLEKGFSYKKVQLSGDSQILGSDIDWKRQTSKLIQFTGNKNIVMRSIRKLHEKNYRPQFFTFIEQTKSIAFTYYNKYLPECLYQLDHLSRSHIKSLFITQDYSEKGIYNVIINEDGRFRLIKVNDYVPVDDQTNEHVWGIQQPWKMVILKVWACLNNGYTNFMAQYQPFKFIQTFSTNNWKYYNLERQKDKFFKLFKNSLDICYIILQTRNSQDVQKMGLAPHNAGFNIIDILQGSRIDGYQTEIKCRFKHQWKGQKSLKITKDVFHDRQDRAFRLQKNFFTTKEQFFNMFGAAYITSLSKNNTHITNFFKIQIPKLSQNTVYLRFNIKNKGFMDFSFIQSRQNRTKISHKKSFIDHQRYGNQVGRQGSSINKTRFLKCKYMLIRSLKNEEGPFHSKLSQKKKVRPSVLTQLCRYQAYESQYLRGYNKGQSHYMIMQPGTYYIRLKSQKSQKDAIYYLNYCCSQILDITQERMSEQQKEEIMQNCMLSLLPITKRFRTKSAKMYCGDTFQSFGYGFIVVRSLYKTDKERQLLIEINLSTLWDEGYELLGRKHKDLQDKVALALKPQSHIVLIFKKIEDRQQKQKYFWPPQSINVFKSGQLVEDKSPLENQYDNQN